MSSESSEELVYGVRLTSAVPARVAGEGKVRELRGLDLAMKLHYLKGVYFFANINNNTVSDHHGRSANDNFTDIGDFKGCRVLDWLETYFMVCGRLRFSHGESAIPIIKFNDAGIRLVEAHSSKTVVEWLAMENSASQNHLLTYNHHVLGPDLGFTPLVFIQVTWFKCGGISVGLSWAHLLGDAFAASTFINMLGHYFQDQQIKPNGLATPNPMKPKYSSPDPLSVKRIDPVGDCWVAPTNCKMGTHSFYLTLAQLAHLHSIVYGPKMGDMAQTFEVISGVIWKCIAKVRKDFEPKVVTICRPKLVDREHVIPYNGQLIGTVEAQFDVTASDVSDLVSLIVENVVDESDTIEKLVEREIQTSDFVVYGSNLTFIDMEEVDIYGFELKGQRPVFASYTISGMGDEGVVHVLPGPSGGNKGENGGKRVILMLPQGEIEQVKMELRDEWCIARSGYTIYP